MFPQPPKNNQNQPWQNMAPGAGSSSPFSQTNYGFNPYQVQTGDTFETIAANSGMTIPQIQQANSGMLVPPPKGSFINLPTNQYGGAGNTPYGPSPMNQQGGAGVQPYGPVLPQNDPHRGRGFQNPLAGPSANPGATNVSGGRGQFELSRNLSTQIANGVPPSSVPASMLGMLDATPASMQAAGYVFNQAAGTWNLPGGGAQTTGVNGGGGAGPQSDNNWQTNDALHIITLNRGAKNRKNKFTTNLKWAKNFWRRKAGKGKNQQDQKQAPVRGGTTPETVLKLHLGSG